MHQVFPESPHPHLVEGRKFIAGPGPEETYSQIGGPHAIQEQMQGQYQGDSPRPADVTAEEEHHHHAHSYHGERMPHGPRVALREGWCYEVAQRFINEIR